MAKFHITKNGEPGPCNAAHRCPLGGDQEHFDTREAARSYYEEKMTAELLPRGSYLNAGKRELNKLAKFTSNNDIIEKALAEGSDTTFRALAKNPNVGMHHLVRAYNSAENDATRRALTLHERFPVAKMSGPEYVEKWKSLDYGQRLDFLKADELNDAHVAALEEHNATANGFTNKADLRGALANGRNKLSQETVNRLGSSGVMELDAAVRSGRFPAEDLKNLPPKQMYWATIEAVDDRYLRGYAEWVAKAQDEGADEHTVTYNAGRIASNPNASAETLSTLAGRGLAVEQVYSNPNATQALKESLKATHPEVARRAKLDALNEKFNGHLKEELIASSTTVQPQANRGLRDTTIQVDTTMVKALGLDKDDVLKVLGANSFNGGAWYNEETGVFKGTVDSTD